jgi:hypothetical protein
MGLQGAKGFSSNHWHYHCHFDKKRDLWIWITLQVNYMLLHFYCETWMSSMEPPKGLMNIQGSQHHQVGWHHAWIWQLVCYATYAKFTPFVAFMAWKGLIFQHLKRLLMDMLTMNACVIMKCRLKSDDYNNCSIMFASPKVLWTQKLL